MPRISISGMMVAATVIALDCAAFRSVESRPEVLTGSLLAYLILSLPMANAGAVAIATLIRRRGRGSPFLRGFLAGGALAWATLYASDSFELSWVQAYADWIVNGLIKLYGRKGAVRDSTFDMIVLLPTFFVWPQFLAAASIGWAWCRIGCREPAAREGEGSPRGLVVVSLATVLILAALPFLAVEAYLRWAVDPVIARFGENSRARVDFDAAKAAIIPGMAVLPESWGGRTPTILAQGGEVRVVGDDDPSKIQVWTTRPGGLVVERRARDFRDVRVVLLDGPGLGRSTTLPHYLLRPAR